MSLTYHAAARKDALASAKLEHRHFAVIAQIIAKLPAKDAAFVARHFAHELARTNPRFDGDRFWRAATATD